EHWKMPGKAAMPGHGWPAPEGDDVRSQRSRSGLAGRRSQHERAAGRGERINTSEPPCPAMDGRRPRGMMFAPSGADLAWPVGGANFREPQDAASESTSQGGWFCPGVPASAGWHQTFLLQRNPEVVGVGRRRQRLAQGHHAVLEEVEQALVE